MRWVTRVAASFNRRTYMIAASGRSALTLKAAMSASSAPTTIRSTFPFAITPTVNCQDILSAFTRLSDLGCNQLLLRIDTVPIRRVHRPQTHRFQLRWLGVLSLQDRSPT